jgi:hypothetical protein
MLVVTRWIPFYCPAAIAEIFACVVGLTPADADKLVVVVKPGNLGIQMHTVGGGIINVFNLEKSNTVQ